MKTALLLLAQYETSDIQLDLVAKNYLGLTKSEAQRRARLQDLPFPAYRAASQKAPWLVNVNDLANWIDTTRARAAADHKALQEARQ